MAGICPQITKDLASVFDKKQLQCLPRVLLSHSLAAWNARCDILPEGSGPPESRKPLTLSSTPPQSTYPVTYSLSPSLSPSPPHYLQFLDLSRAASVPGHLPTSTLTSSGGVISGNLTTHPIMTFHGPTCRSFREFWRTSPPIISPTSPLSSNLAPNHLTNFTFFSTYYIFCSFKKSHQKRHLEHCYHRVPRPCIRQEAAPVPPPSVTPSLYGTPVVTYCLKAPVLQNPQATVRRFGHTWPTLLPIISPTSPLSSSLASLTTLPTSPFLPSHLPLFDLQQLNTPIPLLCE